MSSFRVGSAVAALIALLWLAGALRPLQPGPAASLDLLWYFFPSYDGFFGALRDGAPILWNPYQFCGMPWLGTLQAGFFYPPHLLYALLPTTSALAASTMLHVALAGGSTAAFARRAGLSSAGAVLAGTVFAFGGTLRGQQLHPYLLEASAWLPVGALAVLALTDGRPRRGAIGLAVASGMSWLAGSPQSTTFAAYVWAALFVVRLVAVRPGVRDLSRAVAGLGVGLAAGVLVAAVALLPAAEVARAGMRPASTLSVSDMYPFGAPPPAHLWTFWLTPASSVLSLTALALAALAPFAGSPALLVWALVLGGLALGFSAGPDGPLFGLYLALPLLSWFRVPHRVLIVADFALAIAAGLGVDAGARLVRRRVPAVVLVLALVAVAARVEMRRPTGWPPLPYGRDAVVYSPVQRDAAARLAAIAGAERVWPFSHGLLHYTLPPKLPTVTHLRSTFDYEPLALRRQYEYFVFFGEGGLRDPRGSETNLVTWLAPPPGGTPPSARRRLLDLAAVRWIVLPTRITGRPGVIAFVRDAGLEARPPLAEGLELYENPHVLPRAFVTYRASPAPPAAELLPILARHGFDPLAGSFVEGDARLPTGADAPARGASARILRDDPQAVEVEATLAAPGLVVLADTFFSGWTATVDGAPAPILATNHLFRGVPAPAGTHRVRFAYQPRSLVVGAALSVVTLVALAAARRVPERG